LPKNAFIRIDPQKIKPFNSSSPVTIDGGRLLLLASSVLRLSFGRKPDSIASLSIERSSKGREIFE
jgi:hypothetical protein